jgi:hypothetical protein
VSASGIKVYFAMVYLQTGVYTTGLVTPLSAAGVIKVSVDGGSFADAVTTPEEVGLGNYYYELDTTEVGSDATLVQVNLSGYVLVNTEKDIGVGQQLTSIQGLLHLNSVLDGGAGFANAQYNSAKLMVNARLRCFASKTAAQAATPGNTDGTDGEVLRFTLVGVDNGSGLLGNMSFVQVYP